jgi:hypothetical protein
MEAMPGGGYAEWRLCRVEAMPDGAMPSGGYAEWRLCRVEAMPRAMQRASWPEVGQGLGEPGA